MTNLKTDYKSIIKETSILTVAVAIIAAAVYFFLVPSHASVSSISGLGIVLSNFIPLPLSVIMQITLKRNASSATAELLFHF